MEDFLHRHHVDVGRSLALLGFASAFNDTLQMILQPVFVGTLSVNFGPVISVWFSCALWTRRPWTRTLLICFGWLMAAILAFFAIRVLRDGNLALTFYGTKIARPTNVQYIAFAMVIFPALYVFLRVVYSRKFREEVSGEKNKAESLPPPSPTSQV